MISLLMVLSDGGSVADCPWLEQTKITFST